MAKRKQGKRIYKTKGGDLRPSGVNGPTEPEANSSD